MNEDLESIGRKLAQDNQLNVKSISSDCNTVFGHNGKDNVLKSYHYHNGQNQVCATLLISNKPIAALSASRIGYMFHPDSLHLFTQFHDYDVDHDPTNTLSFNNMYQLAGHIHRHGQRNPNDARARHYVGLINLNEIRGKIPKEAITGIVVCTKRYPQNDEDEEKDKIAAILKGFAVSKTLFAVTRPTTLPIIAYNEQAELIEQVSTDEAYRFNLIRRANELAIEEL